ncbi:MAG: hypothetical protein WDN46_03805 [Methylocella sp.]
MLFFLSGAIGSTLFNTYVEMDALVAELSASPRTSSPLLGAVAIVASIDNWVCDGFSTIKNDWSSAGSNEIFFCVESSMIAALKVRGNGRVQTRDLTFIGWKYFAPGVCAFRTCIRKNEGVCSHETCGARNEFLGEMAIRIKEGKEHEQP